jgi:hypothetical protein
MCYYYKVRVPNRMTYLVITYLSQRTFDFYIRHARAQRIINFLHDSPHFVFFRLVSNCWKTIPRNNLFLPERTLTRETKEQKLNLYRFCLLLY